MGNDAGHTQSLKTLARSISAKKLFECARCNRKFNVANAKENGIYKCVSCNIVMSPVSEQAAATLRAEDVELILDESIPAEVQNALKDPQNVHGKFVLIEKLGEGGMGVVFKAFDVELSRYVALKFIKSQQAAELRAEAMTLASLEHKNIARIYEVGTDFIAMQLIRGKPIEKLEDMVAVCEAVDYAHKRGIVHRDVKPENIMVDEEGNVFVMDFGLAIKGSSGEIAGTPGYIAPELVGSVQGDVYSLGATLYTLLTGKRPIEFSGKEEMQSVITKCKTGFEPDMPENEIGSIVRKATAREPRNRYPTAHEMAADIRRFLTGYPVTAFSSSTTYRIRKALARNKRIAVIAALSLAALCVVGYFAWRASKGEEGATAKAEQTEKEKREIEEAKRRAEQAALMFADGAKIIHESRVYLYRKAEVLKDEMARWRAEVERGLAKIREGLKLDDSTAGHYLIARGLHFMGDRIAAEREYTEAIKRDARHTGARYGRGRLYVEQAFSEWLSMKVEPVEISSDMMEKARADLDAAAQAGGAVEAGQKEIAQGYDYLIRFNYDSALSYARKKVRESNDEEYQLIAGVSLMRQTKYSESLAELDSAIEKRANFSEAYFWRGLAKEHLGDFREGIADYSKAIVINPKYAEAYYDRGKAKYDLGEFEAAIEDYNMAIGIRPMFADAYVNRGSAKAKLGDFKGTIEDCTRAIEVNPNYAMAYNNRAVAKCDLGNFREAIEDHTKAIQFKPKYGAAYAGRGLAKCKFGDFVGAIEDCTEAIVINPECSDAYVSRGTARGNLGDPKGAIDDFTVATDIDPKSVLAFINRGLSKCKLGDYKGAIADCSRAIEITPNYGEAYSSRGAAKCGVGDFNGAIKDYDLAIQLNPKSADSYCGRGAAKGFLNDFRGAIDDFEKALAIASPGWSFRKKAQENLKIAREKLGDRDY